MGGAECGLTPRPPFRPRPRPLRAWSGAGSSGDPARQRRVPLSPPVRTGSGSSPDAARRAAHTGSNRIDWKLLRGRPLRGRSTRSHTRSCRFAGMRTRTTRVCCVICVFTLQLFGVNSAMSSVFFTFLASQLVLPSEMPDAARTQLDPAVRHGRRRNSRGGNGSRPRPKSRWAGLASGERGGNAEADEEAHGRADRRTDSKRCGHGESYGVSDI